MNKRVILYHDSCADGVGGVYALLKGLKHIGLKVSYPDEMTKPIQTLSEDIDIIPCWYGMDTRVIEEYLTKDMILIIVDFSFSREVTTLLASKVSELILLDHHKTALDTLDGLDLEVPNMVMILDMYKSGTGIAMQYVENTYNYTYDHSDSFILSRIEDRDLYNFKYKETRDVGMYFEYKGRTLATLLSMVLNHKLSPYESTVINTEGKLLRDYKDRMNSEILEHYKSKFTIVVSKDGVDYNVPFINAPASFFGSEIGALMYEDKSNLSKVAICFNIGKDFNYVTLSIRSLKGETLTAIDVLEYIGANGGGHKEACGGRMTTDEFFKMLKENTIKTEGDK